MTYLNCVLAEVSKHWPCFTLLYYLFCFKDNWQFFDRIWIKEICRYKINSTQSNMLQTNKCINSFFWEVPKALLFLQPNSWVKFGVSRRSQKWPFLGKKNLFICICKLNFKQRTEEKKEKIRLENALGSTYNKLWFIASAIAAFAHLKILCVSGVFFVGSFVVGFGLCWAIIGLGRLWFASMTFSHFGYWLVRRATRRPKGKRFIQSPKYRWSMGIRLL